jgi:xylitol oxidase
MPPLNSMNKRTFLKLSSAIAATPILSPLLSWAAGEKLKNWAGNFEFSTENVTPAQSLEQVQQYVKSHDKMKALGTRHCFNQIANSTHALLEMKPLDHAISIDENERTVTVEPGMSYGQLAPYLDAKGWALHNLASLPHISVAGSCSTATHGSGDNNGNLSSAVAALEMVTASGDVLKLTRKYDGEKFLGAVVGLGALGVVTKITLNIQPTYQVRQVLYENLPMSALKDHFEQIMGAAYSVSLFTDWSDQKFSEVWLKSRVTVKEKFKAEPQFFGATLAKKNMHPIAALSAENCTEQMGVPGPWYDRLPHFKMGFTPSAGKELQSEYFIPRHNAVEAIMAVEKLHEQITPHLLITEIRSIASDDLWMSPCRHQDCVTIHFTWKPEWPEVRALLPQIEKEIIPFRARPHWGKLFTMTPQQLRANYGKMGEFIELAKSLDPNGKFRNEFLDTNVFAS